MCHVTYQEFNCYNCPAWKKVIKRISPTDLAVVVVVAASAVARSVDSALSDASSLR